MWLMVPKPGRATTSSGRPSSRARSATSNPPDSGTINHTVLTCFAAQQMGLQVAGVIVNGMPEQPGLAEQSAPHQIGSLCGAPVLGIWPHRNEVDEMEMVDELSGWLDGQAETGIVLRELGV